MNLQRIYAIAKKEVTLNLRFKYDYILRTLVNPTRMLISFGIVYNGFFAAGSSGIGDIDKTNYLLFLVLGTLVYSFFISGFYIFQSSFLREKYWRTIQALLVAPVSKIEIILGFSASEVFRQTITLPLFFGFAYLIMPIGIFDLLIVSFALFAIFLGVMGASFIQGAYSLTNENYLFIFQYMFWGWSFLSCFYYPLSALPGFLHPIVSVNPVYQGLFVMRQTWMHGFSPDLLWPLLYVSLASVTITIISAKFFQWQLDKYGISGY